MLTRKQVLSIEHFLLFIGIPIFLIINISIYIKLGVGIAALVYVLLLSFRLRLFRNEKSHVAIFKKKFLKVLIAKLTLIIISTCIITFIFYKDNLFDAITNNPKQYFIILLVYTFLSVLPQEFVYRYFYFERYKQIFDAKWKLIAMNTVVFSLGHLFFNNALVMLITIVGGFIFSLSYYKFKSLKLITIEHSLYGIWLYTVGLGSILGFPVQ